MLSRPILDFLVRYFVTKVNWIEQLLYAPWLLTQYQKWWNLDRLSSVADTEFPVLFLRICCYTSQFFPSWDYNIDSIKGVALADILKSHEEVIDVLTPICVRLDSRGSLVRVLHILFGGLGSLCLHRGTIKWANGTDELEKGMLRRAICDIHIRDEYFLFTILLIYDVFNERVLLAQLAQFWRNHGSSVKESEEYTVIATEERYDKFCSAFLLELSPLSLFNQICNGTNALAAASLALLEGVRTLHGMMGDSHTRLSGVIVPTFDAAVPLLRLCADNDFPGAIGTESQSQNIRSPHPLGAVTCGLTRSKCLQAARDALDSLQNLVEVSNQAEAGARILSHVI
ncbi:hypothetical protein TSTA_086200 [Talaromyces stipitatus ATCC 10500]|uniref:Uncharacterized protein n=1 Tax=Talaromyces stipitatus (strain ATCC 10500 / CBS 375.48 / QM 6759 / NRRL 1006) TaxID=441959 RepID=B8M211_TALSN|nr:uncharacterized protein TSTA_086200 [Talaromyces stipitatus ATCC 10500]EED21389.1 hypothetical protein TSTA_086200 [Talaromyces stipitatus ATCC 10500]